MNCAYDRCFIELLFLTHIGSITLIHMCELTFMSHLRITYVTVICRFFTVTEKTPLKPNAL